MRHAAGAQTEEQVMEAARQPASTLSLELWTYWRWHRDGRTGCDRQPVSVQQIPLPWRTQGGES